MARREKPPQQLEQPPLESGVQYFEVLAPAVKIVGHPSVALGATHTVVRGQILQATRNRGAGAQQEVLSAWGWVRVFSQDLKTRLLKRVDDEEEGEESVALGAEEPSTRDLRWRWEEGQALRPRSAGDRASPVIDTRPSLYIRTV
jgi:hypothetical protein